MNILVVGKGRVGQALRRSLEESGQTVIAMGRRLDRQALSNAELIVLAVPDGEIQTVAERIAPALTRGIVVVHTAGARATAELGACADHGAEVGVLHPLVSFASARKPSTLEGKTLVMSGSKRAVAAGRRLGEACGSRVVVVPTRDAAYHAAAALSANGAAALAHVAVGVLERLGMRKRDAEYAIGGLLESVGNNVKTVGVPGALTGPVARGDIDTVRKHREALAKMSRGAARAYDALLPVIADTAVAQGLPTRAARAIADLVGSNGRR